MELCRNECNNVCKGQQSRDRFREEQSGRLHQNHEDVEVKDVPRRASADEGNGRRQMISSGRDIALRVLVFVGEQHLDG